MTIAGHTLRRPGKLTAAILVIAASGSLSACKEVEKAEKVHYNPVVSLNPIKGDPDHKVITLTQEGVDRIVLRTGQVGGEGHQTWIPYSALLYGTKGETYTYTSPRALTYVHKHIEVDRVVGNKVLLKHGPPAGTKVVTQGAQQLHGAELEFGEY